MATAEHWDVRIGRRLRLRDLHVLLTVAQHRSMAKAAQHLAVSQPAISKAISDLEAALGVRLLDRSASGVAPTLYGSALIRRGLAVFDELRQGIGEIEFLANPTVGEVRVGCAEWMVAAVLPPVLKHLDAQYPGIVVHVDQISPGTPDVRELRERNVDLMIGRKAMASSTDDLNVEVLLEEPLIVIAGVHSPWARRRNIVLADLLDQKWILHPPNSVPAVLVERAFLAQGLRPPKASVTTYSHHLRDALLAEGDYLTVISASLIRVFNAKRVTVKALPVDLKVETTPVVMFTLKNRTLSPVAALFMDSVRAAVKSDFSPPKR